MAEEILTHTHEVIDTDPRFTIDPKTKKIIAGAANLTLAQHAKESERLTFYVPDKMIEGHDLTICNDVQIHFVNIDQATQKKSIGVYKVTDLKAEEDSASLSWLIDDDVTRYAGGLIFSIHFACLAEDGSLVYDFPTLTYSEITVGATVWNSQTIEEEYPDIIRDFEQRLRALEQGANVTPEQIQAAVDSYLDKNPVETGATAEQAAQIQANAEAIADIRDPVVSGNTHWEENTATITMPLASGGSDVIKAEFDDNANLTKITVNGREIPWTTTGV